MDHVMDQVTDRNSIERAPARQPGRPAWKIGAIAIALVAIAGAGYFMDTFHKSGPGAPPAAPALPVTVSKPLQRNVDVRLGFLGQFSAVNQVELRAQVGGILTEIHFQDGQIVHKGDLPAIQSAIESRRCRPINL
jgi:multidrug efflux pump subunit AcrA (membrane-fusion protein)